MIARRGSTVSRTALRAKRAKSYTGSSTGAAGAQLVQMADEQIRLERVRVIVVERGPLLERQIVAVAVVAVVLEHDDLLGAEAVDNLPDDGRLARAGSAGDADHHRPGPAALDRGRRPRALACSRRDILFHGFSRRRLSSVGVRSRESLSVTLAACKMTSTPATSKSRSWPALAWTPVESMAGDSPLRADPARHPVVLPIVAWVSARRAHVKLETLQLLVESQETADRPSCARA